MEDRVDHTRRLLIIIVPYFIIGGDSNYDYDYDYDG
jgi:hypothetical protein